MLRLGAVALAPLALIACGDGSDDEAVAEPTPTATVAAPRTLIAADYDEAMLGARIEGPQGTEVEAPLMAEGREIGSIVSFVACPRETATCDPAAMPEGTVYTYVHQVTLAAEEATDETASAADDGASGESYATLFRTTRRATGFNGSIGYAREQAETALGDGEAIGVTSDEGQLIWRVISGEGWSPGATITFWWQSTLPPEGPSEAWELETGGMTATATAPFPPAEMPVE
ncbi:hypothetical protein A9995_12840 [Erythrobacter sp. QSSC1-22B]|nr:hypothetical protein A9995_12840 [Erythrobacter sp. QSSC1-22B]